MKRIKTDGYSEKQQLSLFEKVVAMGIKWDHHNSDLYLPVDHKSRELINDYEFKCNVTSFKSAIDGSQWYDIPFAYPGKLKKGLQ